MGMQTKWAWNARKEPIQRRLRDERRLLLELVEHVARELADERREVDGALLRRPHHARLRLHLLLDGRHLPCVAAT